MCNEGETAGENDLAVLHKQIQNNFIYLQKYNYDKVTRRLEICSRRVTVKGVEEEK